MDRFRELDRYPKILLIALLALAVVFAGVYGYCSADRSRPAAPGCPHGVSGV